MGFRINTNVQSLTAQRYLSAVKNQQERSLEKLASGNRIVRAGDDAAGLAISEKLRSEIRSSRQAERNTNDGISLIQTAEGGLNEISSIMIRLRELSVQSASDTIGDVERSYSDLEFQSLIQEVDRIANSTKFNARSLLNGQGGSLEIQVGSDNIPNEDRFVYGAENSNATTDALGITGINLISKESSQNNLSIIDGALNKVNQNRAQLGALQNRLFSTVNNLGVKIESLSAANSRIRDADVAQETAELTKANILSASGLSVLAQANNSGATATRLMGG
jgi:flagellin